METIHKNIKKYRLEKGLTQTDLAKALSFSKSQISKWENGEGTPEKYIKALSEALDVSVNTLISEGYEHEKPTQNKALGTKSITVTPLKFNTVNLFDGLFLIGVISTFSIGGITNQSFHGIVFMFWIVFTLYGILYVYNSKKVSKTTLYYHEDEIVIFQLCKDYSVHTLKEDSSTRKLITSVMMITFFISTIFIFTVINQHYEAYNLIVTGFVALSILLVDFIYLIEDTRFDKFIKDNIPYSKLPYNFGLWRFQLLVVTYTATFLFTYVMMMTSEITFQMLGIKLFLVFFIQLMCVLVIWLIKKYYLKIISHYQLKIIKS